MFRAQTKPLLWIGFGGLLLLMGALGISSVSFLYQIDVRYELIRQDFVTRDRTLESLQTDVYLSGTHVRDYLATADEKLAQKEALAYFGTRARVLAAALAYEKNLHPEEMASFHSFDTELKTYLQKLNEVFTWTAAEKRTKGDAFVQTQVLPGRMSLLSLADRVAQSNQKRMAANSRETSELLNRFRVRLVVLVVLTLGLGSLLAGISLRRILQLEEESDMRFEEIARGKRELHDLSAKVLAAHEEERRNIARELHDEVGQALWAVSLGLDNLRAALAGGDNKEALRLWDEIREMSNQNVRMIRNMSLLLRPSMLDDLGLIPALKWLAREVSRTTGLAVEVAADDLPDNLSEDHKTCVYRVVQEALRNCARHARASYARIRVQTKDDHLLLSVQDDGVGFDPAREKGLGLLGMEERVTTLDGVFRVSSQVGRGTTISLELPLKPTGPRIQEIKPLRTA